MVPRRNPRDFGAFLPPDIGISAGKTPRDVRPRLAINCLDSGPESPRLDLASDQDTLDRGARPSAALMRTGVSNG
jgi:hypothetical protein